MTQIEQSYARGLYPRLAILAAGLFVVGTNAFVIAGLLPDIAATLGVTPGEVGYSITDYSLVVAIGAPALSILLPRLSRSVLMSVGLAFVAVGTLLAASAPDLTAFTLGRVVAALGGAALVPAATAAAASLAPVERRGRAIAVVAIGFTAASAFGAPLGTAIAAGGGWRIPLFGLAALAAVLSAAMALGVRNVPLGTPVGVRRRFAVLADRRVLLTLVATLFVLCGFNVVYIFSSAVTAEVTGGSGALLAVLLLIFGISGVVGNLVAGRLTDRYGNRRVTVPFLGIQVVVLAVLPFASGSLVATGVLFAIWGASANAATLPIQHRLIEIDPATAGVALSWYSTAMYAGIAVAPPVGAAALAIGGASLVPIVGAAAILLALLAFQAGRAVRRSPSAAGLAEAGPALS